MQNIDIIRKYAQSFKAKKFIECGYIAVRDNDGIIITVTKADFDNLKDDDAVFVNDKNIDSFEGNFRAAAVILFCAIRQDKHARAAVIADSDAILKFSSKRKSLMPIIDEVAQLCGISVKCATKNVAAEVVTSLSGCRNACFMPDAGAVIKARSLKEAFDATAVLDKACTAQLIADNCGNDTQHINMFGALIEQTVFRFKTAKELKNQTEGGDNNASETAAQSQPSAQPDAIAEDAQSEQTEEQERTEETNQPETSEESDGNGECELGKATEFALFKDESQEEVALLLHPFYASVLSAMGKPMPVPEEFKEELGEEIPCAASAMTCTKRAVKNVCEVIGESPACFIAGHGVVVRGSDADDALEVCRTLEKACKKFIESK